MTLRQYFPLSVGLFALGIAAVIYLSLPLLPFAIILLAGETLMGFQMEDSRVPRFLAQVLRSPKH